MRSRWTAGLYSCTLIQQNCGDTEAKDEPVEGKAGASAGGGIQANPYVDPEA